MPVMQILDAATTHINHRLLGKTTKWEPISYTLHHPTVHPICPQTSASTTFMYNPVLSVVLPSMRSAWQLYRCCRHYHGSICTSSSVCVFIVLCNRLRFALQAMDPICLKPSSNFLKFKGYLIVFGNYLCL